MPGETKQSLPASSQRYLLIFTLLFICLVLLGPFWSYKTTQKLDRQIIKLKQNIEEQKLLAEAAVRFKQAVRDLEKEIENSRNLTQMQPPSAWEDQPAPLSGNVASETPEPLAGSESPAEPENLDLKTILNIQRKGLTLQETANIGSALRDRAESAGLTPESIRPDVTSLMGEQGEIAVDARLTGSYKGMWSFLHDLGSHPAFKEFTQMSIREIPESREMNLKVRFYTET